MTLSCPSASPEDNPLELKILDDRIATSSYFF